MTPAPGAVVASSHPVFSWALPPNERSSSITIADRPETTPEGVFYEENRVLGDWFGLSDPREWAPSEAVYAGTYWWVVDSTDRDTFATYRSAPVSFSVAATVGLSVRVSRSEFSRDIGIEARTRTNTRDATVTAQVLRGGRAIWTAQERETTLIDYENSTRFEWSAPRRVRKGLRLTLRVTAEAGDATTTVTRRFRSP